jgi:hypothetical protein
MGEISENTKSVNLKGNDRTNIRFLRSAQKIATGKATDKDKHYGDGHA